MSDHGLNGGTTFELAFDLLIDPSLLAGGVDPELVFRRSVVTAIAGIGDDAIEHVAEGSLHGGNDVGQCMPVVRVAREGRDMGNVCVSKRYVSTCRRAQISQTFVT